MITGRASRPEMYQLRIVLHGSHPCIWRRVLVPAAYTLGDLHRIIQAVMPWHDCHMHAFCVGRMRYGVRTGAYGIQVEEEEEIDLRKAFDDSPPAFQYVYHLGANLIHRVEKEADLDRDPSRDYPCCLDGAHTCPPEDDGFLYTSDENCRVPANPTDPQHDHLGAGLLPGFHPSPFTVEKANILLRLLLDEDDTDWSDSPHALFDTTRFRSTCGWCHREIHDSASVIARGLPAPPGMDVANRLSDFITLILGIPPRQVHARVAAIGSEAKNRGADFVIQICSRPCADALNHALPSASDAQHPL